MKAGPLLNHPPTVVAQHLIAASRPLGRSTRAWNRLPGVMCGTCAIFTKDYYSVLRPALTLLEMSRTHHSTHHQCQFVRSGGTKGPTNDQGSACRRQ